MKGSNDYALKLSDNSDGKYFVYSAKDIKLIIAELS